eukprot:TRINITY_DN60426_c0_g1_i1.p1 TRINITY_DN60426_c0_g1~~TRINITY_DN60426_c0_g1_i1.p1  ORF type:complete len:379 (+),score=105.39 TRINITY_DN60426_c0_g1_i1:137-1273(+)
MVLEHALFVKIMHMAVGGSAGGGLLTAAGGYTYQKCCYKPVKRAAVTDEKEEKATPEKEADAAVEEGAAEEPEEEERDYNEEQLQLIAWTITGATVGLLGGVAAGPFVAHYSYHLKWRAALIHTAKAAGFFTPVVLGVVIAGPDGVARNAPTTIAVTVGLTACASFAVFPVHWWLGHESHRTRYYLAALRVAICGSSSVLCATFAQRIAWIQRRKKRDPKRSNRATDIMNSAAIGVGQVAGTAIAGVWLYQALTDWAGASFPHWMHELPEVYFLAAAVHLLAPTADHDMRAQTLMARSGLVALHAILFIPEVHHEWILHHVQLITGQAITAMWFGTFAGEWDGKGKGRSGHHDHEPKVGAAEGCEEACETFAHIAHSM